MNTFIDTLFSEYSIVMVMSKQRSSINAHKYVYVMKVVTTCCLPFFSFSCQPVLAFVGGDQPVEVELLLLVENLWQELNPDVGTQLLSSHYNLGLHPLKNKCNITLNIQQVFNNFSAILNRYAYAGVCLFVHANAALLEYCHDTIPYCRPHDISPSHIMLTSLTSLCFNLIICLTSSDKDYLLCSNRKAMTHLSSGHPHHKATAPGIMRSCPTYHDFALE